LAFLIDLHVHTRLGSADSSLDPKQLIQVAAARGLSGVAVAEHYRVWTDSEAEEHGGPGFRVFTAAEVTTDIGHVLVFGLARFPKSRSFATLAREARDGGAALVLAHPFRSRLDYWRRSRDGAVLLDCLGPMSEFHAIEVCNSGCTDAENGLATALAEKSRALGVAGSDAHQAAQVGTCVTAFNELPIDSRDLAARLVAGNGIIGVEAPGLASVLQHAIREELHK
jgi:predicted metal-dependent phosphoesterase TrpH